MPPAVVGYYAVLAVLLLGWVKRSADKYNLIELNDLIGLGYDLSDTQDGLK